MNAITLTFEVDFVKFSQLAARVSEKISIVFDCLLDDWANWKISHTSCFTSSPYIDFELIWLFCSSSLAAKRLLGSLTSIRLIMLLSSGNLAAFESFGGGSVDVLKITVKSFNWKCGLSLSAFECWIWKNFEFRKYREFK